LQRLTFDGNQFEDGCFLADETTDDTSKKVQAKIEDNRAIPDVCSQDATDDISISRQSATDATLALAVLLRIRLPCFEMLVKMRNHVSVSVWQ